MCIGIIAAPCRLPSARGVGPVAATIGQQRFPEVHKVGVFCRKSKQVAQVSHRNHRDAGLGRHRLRGGTAILLGRNLLAVQRHDDPRRNPASGADDAQRLADRGAGGDHVIHDQHLVPGQRRADQGAAFAMVLGFLAIERQRQIAPPPGIGARQRGRQWDALVGGPEQQVEVHPGRIYRIGIALRQLRGLGAGIEAPGVEEVRAEPPRLERELAKAQGIGAQGQLQETGAVVGHGDEIGEWGFAIGKHSRSRLAASADAVRFHESPIPIPESRLFIYAHHQF
ncbi:exonuclease III [Xanthomonas oryzae pv. oryzae KACC 10331]|uniref:Exonuclease III n=1 Tax=Xanthomonas oryzae pv. oryzae (strain KACC10331 / KXO85) TaxID=291331 RepID=Q5H5K9_XANOR|nr:exonuclease III [Xanthomonas oryzae pv. oryzae KACC 10331]